MEEERNLRNWYNHFGDATQEVEQVGEAEQDGCVREQQRRHVLLLLGFGGGVDRGGDEAGWGMDGLGAASDGVPERRGGEVVEVGA
jgi:hypothetical protein